MPRYRSDYDTPRSIPDAGIEVVEPSEEFFSPVELHNALLVPVGPIPQVFNEQTFQWEPAEPEATDDLKPLGDEVTA